MVYTTTAEERYGGRVIPRGETEFRRHLQDGGLAETREEGSDETEVMETEPPGEPDRDKSAGAVETAEDVDVPEEPEAWDSWSKRGDDLDFEPNEEDEEARSDPGDEERLKTRGWHTRPEPPVTLPSSISPRLRDILARSRLASRERATREGLRVLTRRCTC